MSDQHWISSAPSNIALIKYMGKTDKDKNLPSNASLSYTLDHLKTYVKLSLNQNEDLWQELHEDELILSADEKLFGVNLSEKGKNRYLEFFAFLKQKMGIAENHFLVKSNNNFPSDCGLASSASSFAALTLACYEAAKTLNPNIDLNVDQLADLSRQGSGSSCRSFYSPWGYWQQNHVTSLDMPYKDLYHQVFILEDQKKEVSSSEAHKRVESSLLNQGRVNRAELRLQELLEVLSQKDWEKSYRLVWQEFWDMHALFETCDPPFGYMAGGTLEVLQSVRKLWQEEGSGPLVTMDAGANVHCLYQQSQLELARKVEDSLQHFRVYKNY